MKPCKPTVIIKYNILFYVLFKIIKMFSYIRKKIMFIAIKMYLYATIANDIGKC